MMLKRYRLIFFFALAYPLSWYGWIIALVHGKTTGPNPLGPLITALIVTGITEGRGAFKAFLARIIRWRVGIQWYAAVLLLPPAVCVIAAATNLLAGAPSPQWSQLAGWRDVVDRFIFIFLFIGLGEEPGWRGFAIPHLQEKHSPLAASLILAPLWALWHLPLMGTEFTPIILPAFLLSIFPATILLTWVFNRTNSVLLPMLFHSAVNTVGAGLIFPLFTGRSLVALWYIYAAVWVALALVIIKLGGLEPRKDRQIHSLAELKEPLVAVQS